ncbi:MAG: hypothetical protein WCE80_07245 [Acidimicrobiia bacterium]
MELETEVLERVRTYESSSRWDRRELGRDLRRLGLSYGEIMELIPVKKSTLATWCQDVALTPEQVEAIRRRTGQIVGRPRDTQRKRHAQIKRLEARAREACESLAMDPFWTAGVALYWGEGSKTSRRLELTHSEPEALRLFMSWTRHYLDPTATFAASMNLHYDNDENAARTFWMNEMGLRASDFTKTFIKPEGTGHRKNHLATGVCRLRMRRSTDAFLTTMVWVDFMKQTFGR